MYNIEVTIAWLWKIAHLIRFLRTSQIEMRAKKTRADNQMEGATQTTGERSSPILFFTVLPILPIYTIMTIIEIMCA